MTTLLFLGSIMFTLPSYSYDLVYGIEQQQAVPSPLAQLKAGIAESDVICTDNKVLIQKTSKIACVFTTTSEKLTIRGWTVIRDNFDDLQQTSNNNSIEQPISPLLPPTQLQQSNTSTTFRPSPSATNMILDTNSIAIPPSVAAANDEFAINFYKQIDKKKHKNIFFSPTSIYTASSMLYEGARGTTATELQQVFGFESDLATHHNSIANMLRYINKNDSSATLDTANSLWPRHGFLIHESYETAIRDVYLSHIQSLDFSMAKESADIINAWIEEKTRDKIKNVVKPDPLRSSSLVLVNAIYFNGTWSTPFSTEDTIKSNFLVDGASNMQKDFMNHYQKPFNYTRSDGVQVLKLPYDGNRLSMLIILPDTPTGISELEESLSVAQINKWRSALSGVALDVSIPKFTMSTRYDLVSLLTGLGAYSMFSLADFSGISNSDLFVSEAKHVGFVDVNEVGTEAAAVTMFMMDEADNRLHFNANHPFLFIIQDDPSGTILFMGKVSEP